MHAEILKTLLRAVPFRAFVVRTARGELFVIDHPDTAFVTLGGSTMLINLPGGDGERVKFLNTAHIERIESTDTSMRG
jgi:hypothetical protein